MADGETGTDSPFGSEESREFLQQRIATFARLIFLAATGFYFIGWLISAIWRLDGNAFGFVVQTSSLFHLASIALFLFMWLATRGGPLPPAALRAIDSAGTVLACWLVIGLELHFPIVFRPDLAAFTGLLFVLLYRAAVVPSEPRRTAWIGALAAIPLPFATFYMYSRTVPPAGASFRPIYTIMSIVCNDRGLFVPRAYRGPARGGETTWRILFAISA